MNKILISGFGASGKSFCASKFKKKGFYILHLDELLRNKVQKKFPNIFVFNIYSRELHPDLIKNKVDKYFIELIRNLIKNHKKIVLEGKLRNKKLIDDIFKGYDYSIIVVKPKNKKVYKERVIKRFIEDPAHYGRLGFLEKQDFLYDKKGLNDYIKNGIKGKFINKIINQGINKAYKKHKEMETFFKNNYDNVEVIRT